MAMRKEKRQQEWGKQWRAGVPTVASFVVMWGMVAGICAGCGAEAFVRFKLQIHKRAVSSAAFISQIHFI